MAESAWSVVFYLDESGRTPITEFLDSLDEKTQARFLWSIEQLRSRNVEAGEPLVRHIEGKLWELRRESGAQTYRLFYAFLSGRRILLLHGFQKKTQKTPRGEIEVARRRLESFTRRAGGE